jgi:hypothetical protein
MSKHNVLSFPTPTQKSGGKEDKKQSTMALVMKYALAQTNMELSEHQQDHISTRFERAFLEQLPKMIFTALMPRLTSEEKVEKLTKEIKKILDIE